MKWVKRAWSPLLLFGYEHCMGKIRRRTESSSNHIGSRHFDHVLSLSSFLFRCWTVVRFFFCCSHFQYSCWEITSLQPLYSLSACHILYLSQYIPAIGSLLLLLLFSGRCVFFFFFFFLFLLIALTLTLNADGRWPPNTKNTNSIANVMRSNLLRRNCFANKIRTVIILQTSPETKSIKVQLKSQRQVCNKPKNYCDMTTNENLSGYILISSASVNTI